MFPLSVTGSVWLPGSDVVAVTTTLADLFRGLGFQADIRGNAVTLIDRNSTFFPSRDLAGIKRAHITVSVHASGISIQYVLDLYRAALFFPLAAVLTKASVESWIGKAVISGSPSGAASLLQAQRRRSLKWQTVMVTAAPIWVLLIATGFALVFRAEKVARGQFLNELGALRPPVIVTVEGRDIPDSGLFLQIVSSVHNIPGHHSSPTNEVQVAVANGQRTVAFLIGQDSERPDEFHVIRGEQDIGSVSDSRLRSILATVDNRIR